MHAGMRSTTTGLLGNTLDVDTLTWVRVDGGVGAGIDSFYEYLLKVGSSACCIMDNTLCSMETLDSDTLDPSQSVNVSHAFME